MTVAKRGPGRAARGDGLARLWGTEYHVDDG